MVIKLRSIINKIISISVCVLLSFSIYKKCSQESQTPHRIVVQTDSLLSDQTSCALTAFVQTSTSPLESPSFSQSLFSQFPCIASYAIEKNASGDFSCALESAQPVLSINNAWVLTQDGRLAPSTDFSCLATQSLRNVIMPIAAFTDTFRTSIQKLSPELFQSYTVVWLNDQEALLCDRAQTNFSIRFNADSIPLSSIMQRCAVIKNDLEARGVFASLSSKKKPQHQPSLIQASQLGKLWPTGWIADIRFKNQIVLSRNLEGAGYG